ncbi:MAG: pyridoxal phosphate-dependent aminotransferase [Chloroflexi bacterium]|nr:pyridoxal phosphate-dependent aminotransferase [Chloroflexota bacterium]
MKTPRSRPSPIAARLSTAIRRSASRPPNLLLEMARAYPDVISLGRGDPDLPTPAHIVEAGKRALDEGYTHYTHLHGLPELRVALADELARRNGLQVDPEHEIMVTTGAEEAVFVVCQALLNPGDEILIPDPNYTSYDLAVGAARGRVVPVPAHAEDGFVVRPDEVERRITARTKALVIVSPNNPTGTVYPPETLAQLAELALRRNLIVISDEIYELLTFPGYRHVSVATLPGMRDRTVTINGFSKGYAMTGWRVGYIVAPAEFVAAIGALRHTLSICAPAFAQKAAAAALTGPQDCVAEIVRTYDERQRFFVDGLRAIGLDAFVPRGTFYVFVDFRPLSLALGLSSLEAAQRLLHEAHVLIYPGTHFGPGGEGFGRASLAVPVDRIAEALGRMAEAPLLRQIAVEATP